jgi:hypothetical protein
MAGTLVITTLSDGTNSTSATNCIQGSAKAWASWTPSTGAIQASYNVSSVTRRAAGQYTVNFTNALADAFYTVAGTCANNGTGNGFMVVQDAASKTTSSCFIVTRSSSNTIADADVSTCAVFNR